MGLYGDMSFGELSESVSTLSIIILHLDCTLLAFSTTKVQDFSPPLRVGVASVGGEGVRNSNVGLADASSIIFNFFNGDSISELGIDLRLVGVT